MQGDQLEMIMQFPAVMHQLMRKLMRGFESTQKGLLLNPTQRRTLIILLEKGAKTMTQLHGVVGLEKGSLTSVVDQLRDKGLVERQRDSNDRRKVLISLTRAGEQQVKILRKEIAEHIKEKLAKLARADQDRFYQTVAMLVDICKKV